MELSIFLSWKIARRIFNSAFNVEHVRGKKTSALCYLCNPMQRKLFRQVGGDMKARRKSRRDIHTNNTKNNRDISSAKEWRKAWAGKKNSKIHKKRDTFGLTLEPQESE